MESILCCIERVPAVLDNILKNKEQYLEELKKIISEERIDEIIFIGSGTSNTAAVTAAPFVEMVSGLRTTVVTSNEFMYDRYVRNKKALYVFTSQTGTSHFVREAQKEFRSKGYLTVAVSESKDTPLAKESTIFINMGSGEEDCPMRTIGYCASVLIHMLMGLEIGKRYGKFRRKSIGHILKKLRNCRKATRRFGKRRCLGWMEQEEKCFSHSCLFLQEPAHFTVWHWKGQ